MATARNSDLTDGNCNAVQTFREATSEPRLDGPLKNSYVSGFRSSLKSCISEICLGLSEIYSCFQRFTEKSVCIYSIVYYAAKYV